MTDDTLTIRVRPVIDTDDLNNIAEYQVLVEDSVLVLHRTDFEGDELADRVAKGFTDPSGANEYVIDGSILRGLLLTIADYQAAMRQIPDLFLSISRFSEIQEELASRVIWPPAGRFDESGLNAMMVWLDREQERE